MATVLSASGSVPGKPGARLALTDAGEVSGTVGGAGLEVQVVERLQTMLNGAGGQPGGGVETFQLQREAKGDAGTPLDSLCGGRVTVALEVIHPMPHLLLCGGGHCAQAIASACENLEWKHSVFDVREEFADEESHPLASELHHSTATGFIEKEDAASLARFSDILLLGHDWAVDEELLLGLLGAQQSDPDSWRTRIGVIGSRSKWQVFCKSALATGIEQSQLDAVDCPIGLNIGAESPAEIAVAVTAHLIARNKSQDPESPSWREK
jgi:xanthine dehydrogenase accessory factor